MIRVLAADPGAAMGLAVIDYTGGGKATVRVMETVREEHADRFGLLMRVWSFVDDPSRFLVAIEVPTHIHPGAMSKGRAFGIARGLIAASKMAGELAGIARASGHRVLEVEARTWRKAIVGSDTASDARIKAAVLGRLVVVPMVTSAHARDAAGLAVYAAMTVARERSVA